jgi:ubiquinone/menaquinone biosynthesis C-methylase UbiE
MEPDRIARERDFHDQRYSDDSVRSARLSRFYAGIENGFETYWERVRHAVEGRRALEYGCGTGANALTLARHAREVLGIDISQVAIGSAIRMAEARGLRNVQFRVENAEDLQLASGTVDVVVGTGILHHLNVEKAIIEVRRVLSDQGIALFAEPMGHNPVLNWYRNRTPQLRSADEHPLTVSDLRLMSEKFSSARVTYFGLISPVLGFLSNAPKSRSLLMHWVWWLDEILCRLPLIGPMAWYCIVELRVQ